MNSCRLPACLRAVAPASRFVARRHDSPAAMAAQCVDAATGRRRCSDRPSLPPPPQLAALGREERLWRHPDHDHQRRRFSSFSAPDGSEAQDEGDRVRISRVEELRAARDLIRGTHAKARALLRCLPEQGADDFLALVSSPALKRSLLAVQAQMGVQGQESKGTEEENERQHQEKEEKLLLDQAVAAMGLLHHTCLAMVEHTLPSHSHHRSPDVRTTGTVPAAATDRALRLAAAAGALGLPLHRPLYQRLAAEVARAAGSPAASLDRECTSRPAQEGTAGEEPRNCDIPAAGNHTSPAPELLGLFAQARCALGIPPSGEAARELARELLAEPLLLLLRQGNAAAGLGLLRGWGAILACEGDDSRAVDLLGLLGEKGTLDALEVVKGRWVGDGIPDVAEIWPRTPAHDPHVVELINLLEVGVTDVLERHKKREAMISHLLWHLNQSPADADADFDYDGDDPIADADGSDPYFDCEEEISFSVSTCSNDGEEEFPEDSVAAHLAEMPTLPASESVGGIPSLSAFPLHWEHEGRKDDEEEDDDSWTPTLSESNNTTQHTIYLRNREDWEIPDVVPLLEEWNKGEPLTFTPEFERYLGRQLLKEEEDGEESHHG